jgi:hypothetical protein
MSHACRILDEDRAAPSSKGRVRPRDDRDVGCVDIVKAGEITAAGVQSHHAPTARRAQFSYDSPNAET